MSDPMGALCILGAGGHAKVALAAADAAGLQVVEVFDDAAENAGKRLLSHIVKAPVPPISWWQETGFAVHVAIGDNATRARIAGEIGARFRTIIHPNALVHDSARIGEGSLICAGAIIQPDTEIGAHCIINTGAIVEHDCRIGDFSHLAPSSCVTGGVTMGRMNFLGTGAIVIPGVKVGEGVTIAAGSVVIKDLSDFARVAGVPSRAIGRQA
jgi:sugar O-acyltransferase (sialic acid O-acetyltransferase NeuD family)